MAGELCKLRDGDFITIQWSGELRMVVIELFTDATAVLRDLTEIERQAIDAEYGAYDMAPGQ